MVMMNPCMRAPPLRPPPRFPAQVHSPLPSPGPGAVGPSAGPVGHTGQNRHRNAQNQNPTHNQLRTRVMGEVGTRAGDQVDEGHGVLMLG